MTKKLIEYTVDQEGIGHLVFDNPVEKVNSLSSQFIEEFLTVLNQVEGDSLIRGLILESAKPGVFIAGADIKWLKDLKTREDCYNFARSAHPPFNRLEELKIPTLAAINGICLGGGLEIALACKWRVAADHKSVQMGLPEVKLGVIPGGGGTQRLPALIGLQSALQLSTTGKSLKGSEAQSIGLVDAVLPADNFNQAAKQFLLDKINSNEDISRPWLSDDFQYGINDNEKNPEFRTKMFTMARDMVLKQTKGHMPAPMMVIDSVEKGTMEGFKAGLKAENDAFAEVLCSPEARSMIDLFLMQNAIKKVYGSEDRSIKPAEIKKVGVLGAGLMGSGIAHSAIASGYNVVLKDVSEEALDKGTNSIRGIFARDVERGRMSEEKMNKIMSLLETTTEYDAFKDVDIVIEAVFENLQLKHNVITEVEQYIPYHCVFASNTSSLAITELAKVSNRPENFIGLHYFSPVNRMPLLEMIRGERTLDQTVVTSVAFAHATRKLPIVVNDCYGFYTTRIVAAYIREALQCLNDGATVVDIDGAMEDFGMPVGPITLLDEVGHNVGAHVLSIMKDAYPERFAEDLTRVTVDDDRLGRKNQKGFYVYEKGKKGGVDESTYALFSTRKSLDLMRDDVQERIIMALINEVGFCMGENIVTNYNDAEIGLIFGIGFPPFRGGPLHYVDYRGIDTIVTTLGNLEKQWGVRFKSAPYWIAAMNEKKSFFR
ncbi:MAG: enoyl-CoA hydratase/isomerase family protein [Deltaproteobacteria bacterium]|nr:enoyl-CoA hydratase/isomerase family protein [Deltaproteobacteria bacterium]